MKGYYAIEFIDEYGPIYIYTKRQYEERIQRIMNFYNNADLRQKLYHDQVRFFRKEHRGNWESDVEKVLLGYGMTEKVWI